jgi:putative hemolysin
MTPVLTEIVIILLLLIVNGIFAMTEIAVVSARKPRLKAMADAGDHRALAALALSESPNRFLSTVQIGITLVGILAGAFGGATIAEQIATRLEKTPSLAPYAETIGLATVVIAITYLSLVIGELVPKRIGLAHAERIARWAARPMQFLSRLAKPVVDFLSFSTDALLRVGRVAERSEQAVTEDEVRALMEEGARAGAFSPVETEMVESVLDLDRIPVRSIMTPRAKIIWLNRNESHDMVWHKIVVSNRSHFPVYEGDRDHVVGLVSVKAIYAHVAAGIPVKIGDLMTKPLIVPATQMVLQVLEALKRSSQHMALVADEFGGIVGLVTLRDVMEAIIGELPSQDERAKPAAVKRPDGSWLVDAIIEIEKLAPLFPELQFDEGGKRDYQTLAGFVLKKLGHLPKEGEAFEADGYRIEVLDMDRQRVDKVLISKAGQPPGLPQGKTDQ